MSRLYCTFTMESPCFVVHFAPFVRLRTDPAGTRHMAGFFAVRMLRQGREGGFNPFGENPGDDDDDDDDDDGNDNDDDDNDHRHRQ